MLFVRSSSLNSMSIPRRIVLVTLALSALCISTFASQSTWFLKIVDAGENPLANASVLWKPGNGLDWQPVFGLVGYGPDGSNGNGNVLYRIRDAYSPAMQWENHQLADAFANYQFFLSTGKYNDWVIFKVVAAGFRPIELRVSPIDGGNHWQRIELGKEPDVTVSVNGNMNQPTTVRANLILPTNVNMQIVDQYGKAIVGAIVQITMPDTNETQSASTDNSGTATLTMHSPGRASVRISKDGYKTESFRKDLFAGETQNSRISLGKISNRK